LLVSALLAIGCTAYTILRAQWVPFTMLGCGLAAVTAIVVIPRVQRRRAPVAAAPAASPPAAVGQRGRSMAGNAPPR
jgi:hypothetical protein